MAIFLLIFTIWAHLLSNQSSFAWNDLLNNDSPPIILSQLMMLTVVDLSSHEVTRDAFTFLRSIRTFGGDLNQATLILGFTGTCDIYAIDTLPLPTLFQFASYNVELDFISVAESHYARNMNKLSSFSLFDPVRFAYLLWLDADILVLQDPSSFLRQHRYPGAIKCVPEFYNYMIRYPDINSSSLFWNPSLPSFHLVGKDEVAPAGTCNTGVLLLDTYTVLKLHNRAMKALEEDVIPSGFLHDRFLDSLIFVYAINNESIIMQLFPQTMNYMSFFEGEIIATFDPPPTADDVILAHMLWTTEFHCHVTINESTSSNGLCHCTYINEHYNENSALTRALQMKIMSNESACRELAIDPPFTTLDTPSIPNQASTYILPTEPYPCHNNEFKVPLGLDCSLLWPSSDTEEVHLLQTTQQVLSTDIFINCDFNAITNELSQLQFKDPLTVKGRVHFRSGDEAEWIRYHDDLVFTTDDSQQSHNKNATNSMSLKTSLIMLLQDPFPAQRRMEFHLSITLVTSIAEESQCAAASSHKFTKLIVIQSLQPASQLKYSRNQLVGHKPLSLASQLLLPEFLQVHQLYAGRGIIFCCDTNKGMQTVQRLVSMSKNAYLLIFVTYIPSDYRRPSSLEAQAEADAEVIYDLTTKQIQGMLGQVCQEAGRNRCKVVPATTTQERDIFLPKVLSRLRRRWYDFIYIDASWQRSSAVYDDVLQQCYEVLKPGGLLIGSQYWLAPPQLASVVDGVQVVRHVRMKSPAKKGKGIIIHSLQLRRISNAVDKLGHNSDSVLLQTYAELHEMYCVETEVTEESLPAWYFFKS